MHAPLSLLFLMSLVCSARLWRSALLQCTSLFCCTLLFYCALLVYFTAQYKHAPSSLPYLRSVFHLICLCVSVVVVVFWFLLMTRQQPRCKEKRRGAEQSREKSRNGKKRIEDWARGGGETTMLRAFFPSCGSYARGRRTH